MAVFSKLRLLFALFAFGTINLVHAQTFQYARRMGCDKAQDLGASIAVDRQGNQYSTGFFRSFDGIGAQAADFDPGPAFYPMWSDQGTYSTYISKLNAQGNFVWAKQFYGGESYGRAISTDGVGNVYVTGRFTGTVDFDTGPGVFNLTANVGNYDVFIAKLSSAGSLIWAKSIGGIGGGNSNGLTIDNEGNVLVSGFFSGRGDFDPGPDSLYLEALTSQYQAFLVKLTPAGNLVWARNMGGYASDYAGLAVDSAGNCFFSGCFYLTTDLDPDSSGEFLVTSRGNLDVFITKVTSAGQFVWAKGLGTSNYENPAGLTLDKAGNIYTCGSFNGDTLKDVQNSQTIAINSQSGKNDAYLLKINGDGAVEWAYALGDTTDNDGMALASTQDGHIYFAGIYRDSMDFDPGPGTHYLKAKGNPDAFILKLDTAGKFQRVLAISGERYAFPASLYVDSAQNLYATGWYNSAWLFQNLDFDPGPGVYYPHPPNVSGGGTDDIFILKLSPCQTADTLTQSACGQFSLNDSLYTQSGTYLQKFSTPNGCDSTLMLRLTIKQPSLKNQTIRLCKNETLQVGTRTYTQPGTYLDTLTAANGCDSLITTTLAYDLPSDTVQLNGSELTAAAGQDSYQWLDCNGGGIPIAGQTQNNFTPTVSGSYAVRVVKGNCADTSTCLLVVSTARPLKSRFGSLLYPNPSKGNFRVDVSEDFVGGSAIMIDMNGREVYRIKQLEKSHEVRMKNLPPGIYSLFFQNGEETDQATIQIE